jgi:hypothetical protein
MKRMRKVNAFVITRTAENYPAVVKNSFSRGMEFPYPHYYVFKGADNEEEYSYMKLRPSSARCGNIRDSRLNNIAMGITIMTNDPVLNEKAKTTIANIIKFVSEDLGMEKYTIYTDETNSDKFVDIFGLEAKVSLLPSSFNRNTRIS